MNVIFQMENNWLYNYEYILLLIGLHQHLIKVIIYMYTDSIMYLWLHGIIKL